MGPESRVNAHGAAVRGLGSRMSRSELQQPVSAGIIAMVVGYTSSFAVVLTGLAAVGADRHEAASGLLALCLTQAVGVIWLSRRHRIPIVLAWSTPGAALLAGMSAVDGGWPAAVGAFMLAGAAYVLTGFWPALGRLIARIPSPIAQAMLAGVVLNLCLEPVKSLVDNPGAIVPIVLVWLVGVRLAPRWAVPAAFVAAGVVIGIDMIRRGEGIASSSLLPELALTWPSLTLGGGRRHRAAALHRHDGVAERARRRDHEVARLSRAVARHDRHDRRRHDRRAPRPAATRSTSRRSAQPSPPALTPGPTRAGGGSRRSRPGPRTSCWPRPPPHSLRSSRSRPPASSPRSPGWRCSAPSRTRSRARCRSARAARPPLATFLVAASGIRRTASVPRPGRSSPASWSTLVLDWSPRRRR